MGGWDESVQGTSAGAGSRASATGAHDGLDLGVAVNAAMDLPVPRPLRGVHGGRAVVGDLVVRLAAYHRTHRRRHELATKLPVVLDDRSRLYVEQVGPDRCRNLHAAVPVIALACPLTAIQDPVVRPLPGRQRDASSAVACGRLPAARAGLHRIAGLEGRP